MSLMPEKFMHTILKPVFGVTNFISIKNPTGFCNFIIKLARFTRKINLNWYHKKIYREQIILDYFKFIVGYFFCD